MAAATIKVGPQADVRGLGCVLWEMLTGKRLFGECQDEAALASKVLQSDVPRLRTIDPSFDRDLEAIVARATERRIEDRIGTAGQLAQYLQLYLDRKPLPIRPATSRELFVRWCKQNVLVAALSVAVWILLVGLTAVSAAYAVAPADMLSAGTHCRTARGDLKVAGGIACRARASKGAAAGGTGTRPATCGRGGAIASRAAPRVTASPGALYDCATPPHESSATRLSPPDGSSREMKAILRQIEGTKQRRAQKIEELRAIDPQAAASVPNLIGD